jgi:hypothetical protein
MTNRTTVATIVVDDSVCSVDVQKQQNNGTPHKKVVKQGNILKDSETSAAYCVVAVFGTCRFSCAVAFSIVHSVKITENAIVTDNDPDNAPLET